MEGRIKRTDMQALLIIFFIPLFFLLKAGWYAITGREEEARRLLRDNYKYRVWLGLNFVAIIALVAFLCIPKQKEVSVLGVELGDMLTYTETNLKNLLGDSEVTVHDTGLVVQNVYVENTVFNTVEFYDETLWLPEVKNIRMCRYFKEEVEAKTFFNFCKVQHSKTNPKEKAELAIDDIHNGHKSNAYLYKNKKYYTMIGMYYEVSNDINPVYANHWCVCVAYMDLQD